MQKNDSNIVIYETPDGETVIDVRLEGDTVWLSQAQLAILYDTDRTSIGRHIRTIYNSGELDEEATCAKNAQVRMEGRWATSSILELVRISNLHFLQIA